MKPNEFWNSTYRELKLFVESNSLQREKDIKQNIIILEALGNKVINAMKFKKPENKSLVKDIFKNLFEEELKPHVQTPEEQIRIMRSWK